MKTFTQNTAFSRCCAVALSFVFTVSSLLPANTVWAQTQLSLPLPGTRVNLSSGYAPLTLRGVLVHPENPFRFDFIVDTGDSELQAGALEQESTQMIRYFLAALTIPEDEQWVNLSPYEKERIIPGSFGVTDMGRDLLAQDYILKQITASLIYPEEEFGKLFWDRVYQRAQKLYGTTDIPVNTFNKVWIVPDSATVYENGSVAFVTQSRLKIMLEEDYLALDKNQGNRSIGLDQFMANDAKEVNEVSAAIVREIVIPEIEREVNEGENFAKLRQIYHAMILATWFKENLKSHVLGQKYVNQNKVLGVEIDDKDAKEEIYRRYLEAYKAGAYNYIKEEYDPVTQEIIPKKYFSGGAIFGRAVNRATDYARLTVQNVETVVDRSFLGDKLSLSVLLADPQKSVNRDRAVLNALPVFSREDDLRAATVNVSESEGRYPVHTLLDGSRVVNKLRSNRGLANRIYESFMSRVNFEVARLVGFEQMSKVQILATPENVSTVESFWGTPLEDALGELGLSAAEIRDALDFRLSGQTETYEQLVDQLGGSFVEGDIYRAFSNDLFDSILPENMRIGNGQQEGEANAIRWIDYGDSFGFMADEELEDLLAYLVERAAYIRSTLAERLVQRIVEITETDLQRITANVFDEIESDAFVPEQMRARTDYQNARTRARQDFIEGFQQRQEVFRQFKSYLDAQDLPQFVSTEAENPVDAAILSDTMVTSPEQVREGMEALNRLLQRLPAELAQQVGQDLNMIKVFSGVSAEVGFTQSPYQFIVGRLGEVERTILIEAIQADENFAVLQPKSGVYSIVNKRAAREVIAANADLFPAAALRNPDWIVGESAQWLNAAGPEWETRTIRYGLLSGIPRSAAEEFIRFDRTLTKFKNIFIEQEDMVEYMAKQDIPENVKESGRKHFRSVLIGYDVTDEEIDLIIDTAGVGNKFQMLAFNPSHREWVAQAEALLEEGAQYLAELSPQVTANDQPAVPAASGRRDAAVLPDSYQNVGGIDLSPQNLKLLRQGQRIELNLTPVGYENIEIRGLTPVIFQITPVTSLPLLLGQLAMPTANPNPA